MQLQKRATLSFMLLELEAKTKSICLPFFGNAWVSTQCQKIKENNLSFSNSLEKIVSGMPELVSIAHY